MTVAELIKALQQEDPAAVPVIMDPEYGDYDPVVEVLVPPKHDYRVDKSVSFVELRVW